MRQRRWLAAVPTPRIPFQGFWKLGSPHVGPLPRDKKLAPHVPLPARGRRTSPLHG